MITTVQTIEERLEYITGITSEFNPIYHVDRRRTNAFDSFVDMLDYDFTDYRLHFQDDIVIADGLVDYIPDLLEFMERNVIHVLSLFSPARKSTFVAYQRGARILRYCNYLGNIAVIFSRHFADKLKDNVTSATQTKDDDMFINEVAEKEGIKMFMHLPVLVQHLPQMGSVLGHTDNIHKMTSNLFDIDFIRKLKR